MAKVLVTGATGFIGSQLTRRLVERGDEVTCLVRDPAKTPSLAGMAVRLVQGDVRNPNAVRAAVAGNEIVYHLAGTVAAFSLDDMAAVNVTAFQNVAAACAGCATPPTLVFVSSLAAAGPSSVDRARVESDPPMPVSNYGRTKRAAELIAEQFAGKVPITILRPPIVYGEGDQNLVAVFRTIHRLGIHVALGLASKRFSFLYVSDLVDAVILCAERGTRLAPACKACCSNGAPPGYYFAAGDEQPTFGELGTLIGRALGRAHVLVLRAPGTLSLWPIAAACEAMARLRRKPYIFNFDKVREARAESWTCSSDAIRRQLGFAPSAPLAERLRQTADWYLAKNLL
jgi:nucleoside-diphosphate-sugar epimerase